MNVPYLTNVIATLRVTISTDHTSAPVTGATLEMDAPVKVPSDRDLLTLTRTYIRHLEVDGSNLNGSNITVLNDFV